MRDVKNHKILRVSRETVIYAARERTWREKKLSCAHEIVVLTYLKQVTQSTFVFI